jgi:hypothetical protein
MKAVKTHIQKTPAAKKPKAPKKNSKKEIRKNSEWILTHPTLFSWMLNG